MTFKELSIVEPILKALNKKGYKNPTLIQEKAIPLALLGKDILGIAQTGTGKTAAFTIPIIQQLIKKNSNSNKKTIKALILTPTRELALQINECITEYCQYTNIKHSVIFGGIKQKQQTDQLDAGIDILVATPGRLLDLMSQKLVNLNSIQHFVLNEADRMLDMGFIHDIKQILPELPKQRQTLFFSATMPNDIVTLSHTMLLQPNIIEETPTSSITSTVKQVIYFVEKAQKKELLLSILNTDSKKSTLIFSRTKHGADKIAKQLNRAGIQSESIHGDKSQNARQNALSNFKSGKSKVLVATDIAARGIDIQQLELVINFDLPAIAETYVHRIGRTGRAGSTGVAMSFCSQEEYPIIKNIQKLTGQKIQQKVISA